MAGKISGRPLRYVGSTRLALAAVDPDLHGWLEPGDVVLLPPKVAVRLLREDPDDWQRTRAEEE